MLWSSVYSWFFRYKTPTRNKSTNDHHCSAPGNRTYFLLYQITHLSPNWGASTLTPSAQEDLGKRSNQTWSIESGIFEDILRRSVETASWLKQNAGIFPTILDPTISGEHRLEDRPAQEKGVAVQWAQWGPSPAPRLLADLGHLSGFHIFDGYCKSKRIRQSPQNSASLTQGLPRKKP